MGHWEQVGAQRSQKGYFYTTIPICLILTGEKILPQLIWDLVGNVNQKCWSRKGLWCRLLLTTSTASRLAVPIWVPITSSQDYCQSNILSSPVFLLDTLPFSLFAWQQPEWSYKLIPHFSVPKPALDPISFSKTWSLTKAKEVLPAFMFTSSLNASLPPSPLLILRGLFSILQHTQHPLAQGYHTWCSLACNSLPGTLLMASPSWGVYLNGTFEERPPLTTLL